MLLWGKRGRCFYPQLSKAVLQLNLESLLPLLNQTLM